MDEYFEIRCPNCNALNLKVDGWKRMEIKNGSSVVALTGRIDEIAVVCRNKDCCHSFVLQPELLTNPKRESGEK
jgi:hypothetical protein